MKKITPLLLLLPAICLAQQLFSQKQVPGVQTPCTTAQQGSAGDITISYTIGEMPLVESLQKNGLLITQGIIQPVDKGIANMVYECFSQTEVKIYPNPNPGTFSLQLSLFKKGNVKTQLFDATGKLLQTDVFDYNTFATRQYNISSMVNAVYYLQLFFTEEGQTGVKKCAYTIQKIN
jgi:Secretion system C-terminal sorting domain